MTFEDLPDDWPSRPLTEPRLVADVLDLLVTESDRRTGALHFVLCDRSFRLLQPCAVDDIASIASDERVSIIGVFVEALRRQDEEGSLIVAVARPGGLSCTPADEAWRHAAELACAGRINLLGVHVVTPDGSRPVPRKVAA